MHTHPNPNVGLTNTLIYHKKTESTTIRNITVFHQNIHNLSNRIEPLEITLDEVGADIVVLTEHNMKIDSMDRLHINRFEINNFYCREKYERGGVLILSKSGMTWKKVTMRNASSLCEEKYLSFVPFYLKWQVLNLF